MGRLDFASFAKLVGPSSRKENAAIFRWLQTSGYTHHPIYLGRTVSRCGLVKVRQQSQTPSFTQEGTRKHPKGFCPLALPACPFLHQAQSLIMAASTKPKPQHSEAYKAYFATSKWKRLRRKVIFRDGAKCVECGARESLEVHHLTYARFTQEALGDLVTLCHQCHKQTHRTTQQQPSTQEQPHGKANKPRRTRTAKHV